MSRSLNEMILIITGASSGIGRSLAIQLARRGAKLVLAARRIDRLDALNQELGGGHLCVATDVGVRLECENLIKQTIERFGRIDTLVCNAGYGILAPVSETTPEQFQSIFQTNVFGTADCIRAAVPHIKSQPVRDGYRGQVMIVSSAIARRAIPFFGAYAATKAAQLSLGEAMRVELEPVKIAVSTVHPGGTETEFGRVSASKSDGRRPKRIAGEMVQSADTVAQKMLCAIQRPVPEVWPLSTYRWLTGLGGLFPGMVDRVMLRRREQIGGNS